MPSPDPSLCDVLPGVAAVLGIADGGDRLGLIDAVGQRRRVVVLLVDGMGLHLLPRMAKYAPLLASVLSGTVGRITRLRSTFPSTTPTSLVSLGTGVEPGAHGVLGFTVNVPDTDRVLTHISWRDDPDPAQWQPWPTWFGRIARSGLGASVVLPAAFAGSGLTDAAYRGARFCGVPEGISDADNATRILTELRAGPGLVYGYTAALDTAAHVHGIASRQWQRAATGVNELIERVLAGLPPDAALLVIADHGGLDVPSRGRLDMDTDPRLADGVRVIAGEPRVRYVHAVAGAAADVAATWTGVLGDRARVLSRAEAIASGLFGPVTPANELRIGDVVVVCQDNTVVLATAHEPKAVADLVGFHGSDSAAETAIPLLMFPG